MNNNINNFYRTIRRKTESLSSHVRRIAITLTIYNDNNSVKLLDREIATTNNIIALVRSKLDTNFPPDSFSIEFLDADRKYLFLDKREFFYKKPQKPKYHNNNQGIGSVINQSNNSISLGEVEEIFQRKWQEKEREQEIVNLRNNVRRLERDIRSRDEDMVTLEGKIDELEEENDRLEDELAEKNKLKYYANILGIALESVGINKNMLRKPLRGILEDPDKSIDEIESTIKDESEIVFEDSNSKTKTNEDSTDSELEQRRKEAITLIAQFLAGTDNETLANVYYIISEIEQNSKLSEKLINHLKNIKNGKV